jgi:hypothetical protein
VAWGEGERARVRVSERASEGGWEGKSLPRLFTGSVWLEAQDEDV